MIAPAPASFRENNFDLIRLLAAAQVVALHAIEHLGAHSLRGLSVALWYFPGVPIFFVISGFLISLSWERAPSPRQYLWNRALRIYPALWVCLGVSILVFLSAGIRPPSATVFLRWVLAQLTVVQFYNPSFLRPFGTGVLNGSLWTVTVELQFYLVLPLLAILAGRRRGAWWMLTVVALAMMFVARHFMGDQDTVSRKLVAVTIFPYLFFFLVGVLARQLFQRYPAIFSGKGWLWFAAYVAWVLVQRALALPEAGGNTLNPVSIVLIGIATVSLAFTGRRWSARLLRGNDISYGVYIYHMPLVNLLLFHGVVAARGVLAAAILTTLAAILSWHLVERPALSLKGYSARW